MLEKVREALRKYPMVAPREKVLVAVSGGADSLALLYALFWLREEFELELAIAHLDHGIRRDTPEDLKVVRAAADDLCLPLFFERVDVPAYARQEKLNLEEAARRLRRDFLLRTAKEIQAQKIALGHTRTDLAETVLLHLVRGAGPSGLKGFLPVALPFIRPLIFCSREETRAFCEQHSIPFRDDPTNVDTRYLRNALRLEILPRLQKHNPKVEEALARAAQLFGETEEVLEWAAAKALSELREGNGLDLAKMQALPKSVQALLVRALAKQFGITLYRRHVEAILRGVESKKAGEYHLPRNRVARVGGGCLVIEERKPPPAGCWTLNFPGETIIPELGWGIAVTKKSSPPSLESPDPCQIYVSPRKIQFPLCVRAAAKDDSLLPFGEGKKKRVWEVLARQGIPRWERERWPVVVEGNSVVWVVGVRPNGEYSVEEDEKEVISLRAWRI